MALLTSGCGFVRWALDAPLIQLGMDSLDTVTMRNQFNKLFKPSNPGPLPMEVFANPHQVLGGLIDALEASLV